jgi:hypothetical protein
MPRHLRQPLLRSLLALALVTLLVSCSKPAGPEEAIRAVIDALETAAEDGDIGGIMEHLAEDYSDSDSNDKASLRGILFMQLQRSGGVSVTKRVDSITVADDAVTAQSVVFAGLADGPLTAGSTRSDVWRFDLQFRLEGRDWQVTRLDQSQASLIQLAGGN